MQIYYVLVNGRCGRAEADVCVGEAFKAERNSTPRKAREHLKQKKMKVRVSQAHDVLLQL
jgi:hypothetical protein